MATTMTAVLQAGVASDAKMPMTRQMRRRKIDPRTGQALVVLGHAIEYLADEFACEGGSLTVGRGRLEAIQLLMAVNRQIYMQCPEVPTFRQRLRSLLHPGSKEDVSAGEVGSKLSHGRV